MGTDESPQRVLTDRDQRDLPVSEEKPGRREREERCGVQSEARVQRKAEKRVNNV